MYNQYSDPYYFIELLCVGPPGGADVDIGGIGVYISYLIQLSILLAAWLYNRLLSTWLRWATYLIFARRNASHRAGALQAKLDATQQRPALIAGLVDFQKAQAYFSITLQGAALLAIWTGGPMMDATTPTQWAVTVSLVGDVATSGVVCITFGLYMLHVARKTSPYVSAISAIAIVMSSITWIFRTRRPMLSLSPSGPDTANAAEMIVCGGMNPTMFCAGPDMKTNTRALEVPILAFCIIVMLLLVSCQYHSALTSTTKMVRALLPEREVPILTLRRQTPTLLGELRKAVKTWSKWTWDSLRHGVVESIFVLTATAMLAWLVSPSTFDADATQQPPPWQKNPKWTIGQLIAVTIWAPTLIEYLYSAVRGLEDAHEHKYPHPYRLVKDDSGSEDPEKMPSMSRTDTFYRRLNSTSHSHSDFELPLVHVHDDSSRRSSMQGV
ncbi:hypothetical protein LTR36_001884 [Oleoguttula mirabilis]|uniref:Uncharacterized protein n=1 Tax=Oleoguttula mirabilis TaxID=1507867 RepID=A0AAV9JMV5_9PEZI|nr:hypothetical protein LTR36_001884 [Oleoguttula mirabilis]